MSAASIILSSGLNWTEDDFWTLVGRDELHIEKAPAGGLIFLNNQLRFFVWKLTKGMKKFELWSPSLSLSLSLSEIKILLV
jgi:hypothetical protein